VERSQLDCAWRLLSPYCGKRLEAAFCFRPLLDGFFVFLVSIVVPHDADCEWQVADDTGSRPSGTRGQETAAGQVLNVTTETLNRMMALCCFSFLGLLMAIAAILSKR
jgi:hypothetical protein